MYTCSKCGRYGCHKRDLEKTLPNCPSKDDETQAKARQAYEDEKEHQIAYTSACIEAEGYGEDTRLIEIIKFLHKNQCKKIGLAFCIGLKKEAAEVTKILEYHGFQVVSIVCKNGSIPKSELGLPDEKTLHGDATKEPICNPVGQAMFLNQANTDFNLVLGLCVGHDTLFFKHIEGPVTVLAVKDRVTGHNPLAPIYCANGYYRKKFYPENPEIYRQ